MSTATEPAPSLLRPRIAVSLGGAVTIVGAFAPWLRSGSSRRNSFELFEIVERLGFAPDGVLAWALRLWPLVPLLVVAAVVGAWTSRRAAAVALAVLAGVYVAAVAIGIRQAPNVGLIRLEWGVTVTLFGAAALVAGAVWLGLGAGERVSRSRGRARRTLA